jgi:F420-dependent oxidoreductase-like protein
MRWQEPDDRAAYHRTTMRAPLQLDLHIPNFNWPDTPPEASFDKLAEIATTAEQSGFSSLSLMDHLHQIPGVGPRTNWMFEGNTMLAAIAARTKRINLSLLVGGVMYHNPAKLAKITTTIDIISGGRAVLGVGAGWFEEEHRAYGFPFPPLKERFERLEDTLNIARRMFTEPEATYEGTHHSIHAALNNPKPIRGDIPILIGGSGEKKTLRMVAQYADGSNFFGDLERVKHLLGVLEGHCERLGRDPAEITKTRMARVAIGPSQEEAARKLEATQNAPAMAFAGDPDSIGEQAQEYLAAGLDGFTIVLPDVYDLETVALVGETLGAVIGTIPSR